MTTEPDNHENDVIDELTGRWLDYDIEDSGSVESLEKGRTFDTKQIRKASELQLVHSLLLHLADRDETAKEQRIQKIIQKIGTSQLSETFYRIARPLIRYGIAALLIISFAILFVKLPTNTAMAAIDQMITAIDKAGDRTYSIKLLENRENAPPPHEPDSRPMQHAPERAGLDGATLYLRGSDKFVLFWKTPSGKTVINGSDGQTNWHIRPDKPVLVSNDPQAFRIPMPPELEAILSLDLKATLVHIRDHYKVKYLKDVMDNHENKSNLKYLDASKISRDFQGPKNIEIWADAQTGLLVRIEFADIHLEGDSSPKRLIIELVDQTQQPDNWFTRQAHHPENAQVDFESEKQEAPKDNPLK
jgi:hypothetical protein